MITIHNVEQGTKEWLALRAGLITSCVMKHFVTATLKIANNDKTRKIHYKLASERITGYLENGFSGNDMERGTFEEPLARDLYNEDKDIKAVEYGFITNIIEGVKVGYSPDGLVGSDGLIEIKSAKQSIQVERIVSGCVPPEHLPQIHFGILVSERKWCDFVGYSNGMEQIELRLKKDEEIQEILKQAIVINENKIQSIVDQYFEKSKTFKKAQRIEFNLDEINI